MRLPWSFGFAFGDIPGFRAKGEQPGSRAFFTAFSFLLFGTRSFGLTMSAKVVQGAGSVFRKVITSDGSSGFKAEAGRYHLYISLACPWASRCYFLLKTKGLEKAISKSIVHWNTAERGWEFRPGEYRCDADTVCGKETLRQVYEVAQTGYDGKVSVPVLFDKVNKTIVNNESSEIIRMLNSEFDAFAETDEQRKIDLYPESLRSKIDEWNDFIFP